MRCIIKKNRTNDEINAVKVRLISQDGDQLGVLPLAEAKQHALDAQLDLVEIAPDAKPPVCKLMDFKKHLFDQKKKKALTKKKQKQIQVKEIKFRPNTDVGDYKVKLNNLIRFLEEGNKAKVTLRFRGQELRHQELGVELMERVKADLADYGEIEQDMESEKRQIHMIFAPLKRKN